MAVLDLGQLPKIEQLRHVVFAAECCEHAEVPEGRERRLESFADVLVGRGAPEIFVAVRSEGLRTIVSSPLSVVSSTGSVEPVRSRRLGAPSSVSAASRRRRLSSRMDGVTSIPRVTSSAPCATMRANAPTMM